MLISSFHLYLMALFSTTTDVPCMHFLCHMHTAIHVYEHCIITSPQNYNVYGKQISTQGDAQNVSHNKNVHGTRNVTMHPFSSWFATLHTSVIISSFPAVKIQCLLGSTAKMLAIDIIILWWCNNTMFVHMDRCMHMAQEMHAFFSLLTVRHLHTELK